MLVVMGRQVTTSPVSSVEAIMFCGCISLYTFVENFGPFKFPVLSLFHLSKYLVNAGDLHGERERERVRVERRGESDATSPSTNEDGRASNAKES